jgi:hypothetical protein
MAANTDEWKRSGNKDADEMHLYRTGLMYDCTLRVSSNNLDLECRVR